MKKNHIGSIAICLCRTFLLLFSFIVANSGCSKKNTIPSPNPAAISNDLLEIEKSYETHIQKYSTNTYQAPVKYVRIINGQIAIDAVAADDAKNLLRDLQRLGLQKGAAYGRKVSGLLPIEAVDKLQNLKSLKSIRPAYMKTNVGQPL